MKIEIALVGLVGIVLGAAGMLGYQSAAAKPSACEAFYSLAAPMNGTATIGRTTSAAGVVNPGSETSYVGALLFTDDANLSSRPSELRRLFDRCVEEAR